MTIYVIVHVTYDHYRFQDNLAATTNPREAVKLAKISGGVLPIVKTVKKTLQMDENDTPHIYIEKFKQS